MGVKSTTVPLLIYPREKMKVVEQWLIRFKYRDLYIGYWVGTP